MGCANSTECEERKRSDHDSLIPRPPNRRAVAPVVQSSNPLSVSPRSSSATDLVGISSGGDDQQTGSASWTESSSYHQTGSDSVVDFVVGDLDSQGPSEQQPAAPYGSRKRSTRGRIVRSLGDSNQSSLGDEARPLFHEDEFSPFSSATDTSSAFSDGPGSPMALPLMDGTASVHGAATARQRGNTLASGFASLGGLIDESMDDSDDACDPLSANHLEQQHVGRSMLRNGNSNHNRAIAPRHNHHR